jgi:protein tyrosine/serine phosphatase
MPQFDLTTSSGRAAASFDAMWRDHSFLRVWWQNAHWISDEMVRTNQPWPFQIRRWGTRGIRTIINLRGGFDTSFHELEKQACDEAGIALVNFTITSRDGPKQDQVRAAKELFDSIAYPALMHCKSGADRAGLMSVLYLHFRKGEPIDKAMRMLNLRYGHIRQGKTGVLDYFFERYLAEGAPQGLSLIDWTEQHYDRKALKQEFQSRSRWWANVLVDNILRRE